jgi:hypothetical protein
MANTCRAAKETIMSEKLKRLAGSVAEHMAVETASGVIVAMVPCSAVFLVPVAIWTFVKLTDGAEKVNSVPQ